MRRHPLIGIVLREWHAMRRMSQMGLALVAGVSTRYPCFIESGTARSSRETKHFWPFDEEEPASGKALDTPLLR